MRAMPSEFQDHFDVPARAGLSVAALAASMGVPEYMVLHAVRSGCRSEQEIREWLRRSGVLR